MQVSVIIPVYNAARFVADAVQSALQQPETAEVLLIEDGSQDGSWEVCCRMAQQHGQVRGLRHPDGTHRGTSASRNLGMQRSTSDFIAFLDADDYYLPGRFTDAARIFREHDGCDGVYEATGLDLTDAAGRDRAIAANKPLRLLHTVTRPVDPADLWRVLISGRQGDFHLNGFVMKKTVLGRSGYMCEALDMHEDTNFIIRVAVVATLWPGRLETPVAMWRAHGQNRISAPRSASQRYRDTMRFWMETHRWSRHQPRRDVRAAILKRMIVAAKNSRRLLLNPLVLWKLIRGHGD